MLETGFTLGAVQKGMMGITHVINQWKTLGLNVEYCNIRGTI